jgi:sugar lactone lactonase YvrE
MKRYVALLIFAISTSIPAAAQQATPLWTATEGLDAPESAFFDAGSGTLFVSVVGGSPAARDGNGRIAKLSLDGKVTAGSFTTGLNAPKGLRGFKGTLWVADLDEVIGIDMASGKITSRVKIADAKFLNDVAVGPDGTVYASDTMLNRVYAVTNGNASVFVEGADLAAPNGLLVDGGRLVVGSMGSLAPGGQGGGLMAIDLKTKAKTPITPKPVGAIDGVESDGSGGYIVTDFRGAKVLHITPKGEVHELKQLSGSAADLAVIPAKRMLVVPNLQGNSVSAYDAGMNIK